MSSVPWRAALGLAGLTMVVGGSLHPKVDASKTFDQATALMLAAVTWVPSHALLLVGFLALIPGLLGLAGAAPSDRVARAARLAAAGFGLAALEMAFHLAAVVEVDALDHGGLGPITLIHLTLATLTYPVAGVSVAVLAWLAARDGVVPFPPLAALGVLGGALHALSAPIVVAMRDQRFSPLFMALVLVALWVLAAAVLAARRPSRAATTSAAPA